MKNRQVRSWYKKRIARIPDENLEWIRRGDSLETRARRAWQMRHDARVEARRLMEDPAEVEALRQRDLAVYGTLDGPTFEWLVESFRREGLSVADALERILSGATTTNAMVDRIADEDEKHL